MKEQELNAITERYRNTDKDLREELADVKSLSEEKRLAGEDISAEIQKAKNIENMRDAYYDKMLEERNLVIKKYQEQIERVEEKKE